MTLPPKTGQFDLRVLLFKLIRKKVTSAKEQAALRIVG